MPRRAIDELTVAALNKLVREIDEGRKPPRLIRVGGVGGLALNVRRREYASGEALSASWVLRRTFEGRRRDFALGAWPEIGLAQARERARTLLDKLWQGVDPTQEKRAAKAPLAPSIPTFRAAAADYFERAVRGRINALDEGKWFNDLESFAFPSIGDKPVNEIERHHIIAILDQPHIKYGSKEEKRLADSVPERAERVIKKIERILEEAKEEGLVTGDNPARRTGRIKSALAGNGKDKHHAALPHAQLPAFMAALRARDPAVAISVRPLEFLILTAARSGEVREATWDEIDLEQRLWTIPAARMKASRDHRVPLSAAAVALLRAAPRFAQSNLIWPGQKAGALLSGEALVKYLEKMHNAEVKAGRPGWKDARSGEVIKPHGFRSCFKDWATDHGYDRDMTELALAHTVGSAVERAYRRTDMLERRRAQMEDWAAFALSEVGPYPQAEG